MRTRSICLIAAWIALLPGLAGAQEGPGAQERTSPRSGFWLRGNVGYGYARYSSDQAELSGEAVLLSISLGKFFGDNVVGFVDVVGSTIIAPTLKRGGVTYVGGPATEERVVGIGIGGGYYVVPSSVFIGGSLSMATESYAEAGETMTETDPGPALSLILGKDFVISNRWTLGVAGHGLFATMTEKVQPVRWTTAAGGVSFTFSFAPERWR
jgi:hypothetical protein